MARKHFLGKARIRARQNGEKDILNYLKDLGFTAAKVPEQLNNYLADYVLDTRHYNGYQELKARAEVHISGKDISVPNCTQTRLVA